MKNRNYDLIAPITSHRIPDISVKPPNKGAIFGMSAVAWMEPMSIVSPRMDLDSLFISPSMRVRYGTSVRQLVALR